MIELLTKLAAIGENGKIPIGKGGVHNVTKVSGEHLINSLLNTIYLWAGIVCVLTIVIAGYIYVTSNGDQANITRGKNAILAAIAGLVVVTMAFVLTNFVIGQF